MNSQSFCRVQLDHVRCGLLHGHSGPHACCDMHQKMVERGDTMPADYWDVVEANKRHD